MRSLAGAGRERTAAAVICASVTLLATLLAFWWSTTDRITLTGDEPHYLILTASLLRDGDLDIGNNYAEDARTREIYGPVEVRHSVGRDGREWPSHTPGISVLLVPAFALAGGLGARLMLCLLIIPILGWACWRWFRDRAPPGDVALVIAGVLLCPPVLFGSSQVYPTCCPGAILLALAVWLWNAPRRTPGVMGNRSGGSSPEASPGCTSGSWQPPRCFHSSGRGRSGEINSGATARANAGRPRGGSRPVPGWPRCVCLVPARYLRRSVQRTAG